VSDETDQVVYEQRHANELAGILAALEPYRRSWSVCGSRVRPKNWYWLVDGLMEGGYRRSPGEHRGECKKYEGLKYKPGDEADAAYLAKLLRTGATSGGLHLSTRSTRSARPVPQADATGAVSHRAGSLD